MTHSTAGHATDIPNDRSVPRARRRAGDRSIDGRGRVRGGPAILSYGFRPFFLCAAAYAAAAVPLWLWMYRSGAAAGPFAGAAWHAHEMIFGYLGAVMAGFVLTAVPNWTGRLPLSGGRLGLLVLAWMAGRVATATLSGVPAAAIDLVFPAALAGSVWREVAAGRNFRNIPVAALLTFVAAANLLHHAEAGQLLADEGRAVRLALGAVAVLIALIGGRITPSFTRNWLVKQREMRLPAPFGRLDKLALVATACAAAGWVAVGSHPACGVLLAAAGALLLARVARWRGLATLSEPIVAILHLGYLWLAAAMILLGASMLAPDLLPESAALHALTAGAIGTMTLAVMTRASLGHTGRTIVADGATLAIYAAVSVGAVLRVAAPLAVDLYWPMLVAGGTLWSGAFALFVVRYGPILFTAKPAGAD